MRLGLESWASPSLDRWHWRQDSRWNCGTQRWLNCSRYLLLMGERDAHLQRGEVSDHGERSFYRRFGGRFVLLTVRGRRTGLPRSVVLEVLGPDPSTGGIVIAPRRSITSTASRAAWLSSLNPLGRSCSPGTRPSCWKTLETGSDPGAFWAKWIEVVVERTPPETEEPKKAP